MVQRLLQTCPTELSFSAGLRTGFTLPQEGAHQRVGKPVLVFLGRPATPAHQHAVDIPARKHPENVPRRLVAKSRTKRTCVTKEGNHAFFLFVAQILAFLFQFGQFRCNDTCTPHEIKHRTLRAPNLLGNGSSAPQTGFGIGRSECLAHDLLVVRYEHGLIQERDKEPGFRLEDGVNARGGDFRPPGNRFNGHPVIAFCLQELPGSFNDAAASVVRLTFANERFVGTHLCFCQAQKYSILY